MVVQYAKTVTCEGRDGIDQTKWLKMKILEMELNMC